jgi:hypothetical protein
MNKRKLQHQESISELFLKTMRTILYTTAVCLRVCFLTIKEPYNLLCRLFTISFLPEPETQMALGRQVRRKESQVRKAVKVKWKKHEKEKPLTSSFFNVNGE